MIVKTEQLIGMPVLSLNEAKHLGEIKEIIIDSAKRKVAGFMVQTQDAYEMSGLWFHLLSSIGEDAVMVPSESSLIDPSDSKLMDRLLAKHAGLKNCSIFTKEGKAYGSVIDFAFNTESGLIAYVSALIPEDRKIAIDMSAARTFGQNILIINQCTEYIEASENLELFAVSDVEQQPVPVQELYEKISAPQVRLIEQAQEQRSEPVRAQTEDNNVSIQEMFERQHARLLLGKKLVRNFILVNGTKLAGEGDVVTEDMLKTIIKNKQLVELMVSVEKG